MRRMSSTARWRSAALSTLSGIAGGDFSWPCVCPGWESGSVCRRERYISRWMCGPNQGSRFVDFAVIFFLERGGC